ncbi:MAG: lytic transglycosylase domain-containing protein [Anaerovibrio sp.]|nr:lytic transglycosylase domain-containing protein [Anaerovibrio sp.]
MKRREYLHNKKVFKRKTWSFVIGVTIIFSAFLAFFVMQQETVQRTFMFPYHYRELVQQGSELYGVDEYIVVAVIKTESNFKNNAKSNHGAVGLMQLMPETALWISEEMHDHNYSPEELDMPERNIQYGSWYLARLLKDFHNNKVLALAAYNAGRGNVEEWMEKYGWGYDFSTVEAIPFKETELYVKGVLRNEKKYRQLYQNE